MSETALRAALAQLHIDGEIASHGTVAVLITARPEQLADGATRVAALDAAIRHGFRALALELADAPSQSNTRVPVADVARVHRS